MPLITVYAREDVDQKLGEVLPDLKRYVAELLTCGEIKLTPEEISIRIIGVRSGSMIANVEFEIVAHAFPERVQKQDEICNNVMRYVKEKTGIENRVWLQLSELGHSW